MQEIVCRVGSFWGSYTMWTWALGAGTAAAMVLTAPVRRLFSAGASGTDRRHLEAGLGL